MSSQSTADQPPGKGTEVFAGRVHSYLQEFIRSADQKAGLLLPAATALSGFMLQHVGSHKTNLWATTWHWAWRASELSVVLGICSAALALYTVLPKQQRAKSGLIAFRGITDNHSRESYIAAVRSLTDPSSEIAAHSYDLAKILRRKYQALVPAMWAFFLAGLAAVATLVAR